MLQFLKIVMFFIAAIWGVVLGGIFSVGLLILPEGEGVPAYISVLWLTAALGGFIVPCVLVRLKYLKIAAGLSLVGAVMIIVVHFALSPYTAGGIGWFYLPLLLESAAVTTIAGLDHAEKVGKKHDAPAESILGGRKIVSDGGYKMRTFEDDDRIKQKNKRR